MNMTNFFWGNITQLLPLGPNRTLISFNMKRWSDPEQNEYPSTIEVVMDKMLPNGIRFITDGKVMLGDEQEPRDLDVGHANAGLLSAVDTNDGKVRVTANIVAGYVVGATFTE